MNSLLRTTDKYSEAHFAQRISDLQATIRADLPFINVEEKNAFVAACDSIQSAIRSKKLAQELLESLQKEKASDDTIQKAKGLVDATETTKNAADKAMIQAGRIIVGMMDPRSSIDEAFLLECTVLIQSTPKGMADWVAEAPSKNSVLLDSFLSNLDWMKQMIICGGASNGHYGAAISIHAALLLQIENDELPGNTMRHKLALATALEHATPISVFHQKKAVIDPIHRFWHYVHAYENGELDKNFENFSTWELRMVVDSNAVDEELQWGRDYLKAYRPDQISSTSDKWRYLWTVRTDVGYRHPEHDFNTYKELISAGGECGPRAFMGRFICKAWGNPTWGVRQPGHAAISRWTPEGWTMCMGAAFQWSTWSDSRYGHGTRGGLDFVEETHARNSCCPSRYYEKMDLLECIAECLQETVDEEVDAKKIWRSLSLVQRRILADQEEYIGTTLNSEQDKTCDDEMFDMRGSFIHNIAFTEPDPISTPSPGYIVIPATAFIRPSKPNKNVLVMESYLGGSQLHLEHDGSVTYQLPFFIESGEYSLSARVVTIHEIQTPLQILIESRDGGPPNKSLTGISVDVPYTGGEWRTTVPLKVRLLPGSFLSLTRDAQCHGLTIKDINLQFCSISSRTS